MGGGVNRRGFLFGAAASSIAPLALKGGAADPFAGQERIRVPFRGARADVKAPVRVVVIGCGGRGRGYATYAAQFPDCMKVVGIADINPVRRKEMAEKYGIPAERCYGDWSELTDVPKFADAAIVALPDHLHYRPALAVMERGYDLLLEKPAAQTEAEVRGIYAKQQETGRIVALCHVLRYAPYFLAMKHVVDSGAIGRLVSVQHLEPIAYDHMAHSYVRGQWGNSKKSTPIILAKSCHDLDLIRWMVGSRCKQVSAEGSLALFTAANAPAGAPMRCTDGCPHEKTCPYSALDIYCRKRIYNFVFDLPKDYTDMDVIPLLKTTPYGRCVYHCDNDQPDHYVANLLFENGVTAAFSMEAFTPTGGRRTRLMGTTGFLDGNMETSTLRVTDFRSGKVRYWNEEIAELADYKGHGHGGGDLMLVRDFVEAVHYRDPKRLTSLIADSVESHLMGFACERSRLEGRKVCDCLSFGEK